jgi:TonB family protein
VPAYPAEAIRQGLESCVLAAVEVSASGEVSKVVIVHADVANIFDQSVIDAQSNVHYLPARRNGENLPSRVLAVVGFTLEPERHLNCAMKYAGAARAINALPVASEIDMKMVEGLIGKQ